MYTAFSTYLPLNSLCELSRERVWLWATSFNSSCITTLSWIPASLQAESWTLINQLLLQISFWASSSHGNTSNVIIPCNWTLNANKKSFPIKALGGHELVFSVFCFHTTAPWVNFNVVVARNSGNFNFLLGWCLQQTSENKWRVNCRLFLHLV